MLVYFNVSFFVFFCFLKLPARKIYLPVPKYMSMLISFFISQWQDYPKFITTRFSVYFVYYHILVFTLSWLRLYLRVVSFVLLLFFSGHNKYTLFVQLCFIFCRKRLLKSIDPSRRAPSWFTKVTNNNN